MRLILATLVATSHADWDKEKSCWRGPTSRYDGNIDKTKEGITCQKWNLEVPHKPKHRPKEVQDGKIHNYCRNPDLDLAGPWCYTTDPDKRWDYCDISACDDDDSYIIWTNFDAEHQSSHLVRVHANPEVVRDQTDQSGSFNVHAITMTHTNESLTEYWALAGDYQHQTIYWTDYRAEHIGKYDWQKNITTNNLYKGMAHGIENLAVDWLTGNLYWTDSDYKWIMVANKDFSQYKQVYKATDDPDGPPYGLAIHSTKQYLFWSTYKIMGATIKRADLTANENGQTDFKVIVKFPVVHDVTGLTVDYVDNRIYWTDFLGSAAVVSSSDFEGKHIINHFHRTGSVFWGVACYDHYLYVSDIYPKFMQDGKKYMLWVVTKLYVNETYTQNEEWETEQYVPQDQLTHPANEQKSFRYSITGRPRGVSVYSKYAAPVGVINNPCAEDSQGMFGGCDHICIPKKSASSDGKHRVCKCGIGYDLKKPQQIGCYARIQNPPYLVFADVDHGLIFQMSLEKETGEDDELTTLSYNVVPSRLASSIHALCIDPVALKMYYADKLHKRILARDIHESKTEVKKDEEQVIHEGVIAQSCVVDNEGNNIFFVEGETRNIQVISTRPSSASASLAFTVHKAETGGEAEQTVTPNIQNIAIDSGNRRIYWTDPTLTEGQGKISSSNFDGSDYKIVIKDLNWPQGIKIYNHESEKMLIFTEALTGVIYEIKLSYLATIGETPISGKSLEKPSSADAASIIAYNITEANPRLKQFHMDIAVHGDYLYYTDLKNNAIERINRADGKKDPKSIKPEQFGPAEFYSLIYMYAVTKESLADAIYDKTDCTVCADTGKICLPKLNTDKKAIPTCKCGDGFEPDNSDNCVKVETTEEYIIDNCPADSQQSTGMCASQLNVTLFTPQMSRSHVNLPLANFDIKKAYFKVGKPSQEANDKSFILLENGQNIIRYDITDKQTEETVSCQYSINAVIHSCDPLDVTKIGPGLKISGCNCANKSADCTSRALGTALNIQCEKENQKIQPMIGKQKLQDVHPNMDISSWTAENCKGANCTNTLETIFPSQSILYRCDATSKEFQIPQLSQIDKSEELKFECVDVSGSPMAPTVAPSNPTASPNPSSTKPTKNDDGTIVSETKSKSKGGVAAVVIIVIIAVAIISLFVYKKMRNDYDGGFTFKGIFSRAPDPTAEMDVPDSSTPYSAM